MAVKGSVSKKQVWEVLNGCGKGTVSKKQVWLEVLSLFSAQVTTKHSC